MQRRGDHGTPLCRRGQRVDLLRQSLTPVAIGTIGNQQPCAWRAIKRQQQRFATPVAHIGDATRNRQMEPDRSRRMPAATGKEIQRPQRALAAQWQDASCLSRHASLAQLLRVISLA